MMQNQIPKNHMDIPWHQFTGSDKSLPITQTGLTEKASVIGRTGLMMLSCGTGAWRVRSSMNSLATLLGVTCTADIGLMSIEYTCFDGEQGFTQSRNRLLLAVSLPDKYRCQYFKIKPAGTLRQ